MRKVFLTALAFAPVLLHAQASSPAQPDSPTQAPILHAKLALPRELAAPANTNSPTSSPAVPLRISTGVVPPQLIRTVAVPYAVDSLWHPTRAPKTLLVDLVVDEAGRPTAAKIVHSTDPVMNDSVLTAVRQYRFKPATVSGQPIAAPITLQIVVNPSS